MSADALLDHFSALEDPRQAWKVVYPLPEVLLTVHCATMAGAEDFAEIDGKTSRRSHNKAEGQNPLHLVSAWASRQRLVLGQQACAEKSNEITAIPALLERLELTGALVTIDAMGCQTGIAEAIRDRGADYLLALKDNWPALAAEVVRCFEVADPAGLERCETTDGEHGRIEIRRHAVCHDVGWLISDRRFPGEWRFKDLAMIAVIEATTERGGKTSSERRYYLSSAKLSARHFAQAVRAHWHIENRLHWVQDVVFHDDLIRLRTDNGPANMAAVRHMSLKHPPDRRQGKPQSPKKSNRLGRRIPR